MNLKKVSFYVIATTVVAVNACKKPDFQTNANGLQYKIFAAGKSEVKPKKEDIVEMHYRYTTMSDSTLYESTKESVDPIVTQMPEPPFKGSFQEGMMLMSPGDSAVMIASADSFFAKIGQALPAYFKKGDKMKMFVKVYSIQSLEAFQTKLKTKEVTERNEYIAKNNITTPADASGLISIIQDPGTGMSPMAGDTAVVNYTGKLLNGKEFDSSVGKEPISFPLGVGRVIPGWDMGLMKLKEGGKATLIIPSDLAYGPQGSGPIPPASTLVFEVQLLKVIKGVPPTAQQPGMEMQGK